MRSLEFNVTSTTVTPNTAVIGNAGEHNVTELNFKVGAEITDVAEYFRLSIGDFRSEKLYVQNSTISYSLPRSVLQSGTVLLQLDGYNTENGEINRIFKSALITAEVGPSVFAAQDVPTEMERDVDGAISELTKLVEEGGVITEDMKDSLHQLEEIKSQAEEVSRVIENKSIEVENNRNETAEALKKATEEQQKSTEERQKAEAAAETAAYHMRMAQNSATEAEANAQVSEFTKEEVSTLCEITRAASAEAVTNAETAVAMASAAENAAIQAKNRADYAAETIDRVETIIAEELPVYTTLYKNDTPDWVSHDESSVDPYTHGKDVYFKADIKAGEKYVVRFSMEHQEGHDDIIVLLSTKNSGDYNDRIFEHTSAFYNEVNECYEVEYTANRSSFKGEELMLFVGYPYSGSTTDYDASFGWVHILHQENLQSIVDNQNIKIAAIGEDIETALDGIITLQENLIGGDAV